MADQCDYSYFAMAMLAERLNLRGPSLEQAQIATNKHLQRMRAERRGILQPQYEVVTSSAAARRAAINLGFPVILKPVDNRGSFGVNKVESLPAIDPAYFDALRNSHSRFVLVEQFIEGVHITIDGYCFPKAGHRSLSLATKRMLGGRRQVAIEIIYPGELPEPLAAEAIAANDRVIEAMGFSFGMTHAEYMIDSAGQVHLIEVANRGGGCLTSAKIVPAVSGIDITQQLVEDCMGTGRDLYQERGFLDANSALLKFLVLSPGRIERLTGITTAGCMPGVEALMLRVCEGDLVKETTTDADRHGFVITSGRTRDESRRRAEAAEAAIEVGYA